MYPLLMAAQAAGMITDYIGTRQQIMWGRMGQKLEQASITANIAMTKLQAEQQSLAAMQDLRQTLASQNAIFAARGTRAGVGTTLAIANKSVGNFNADERMRRMNLLSREAELRASGALSGLHQLASESQLGQALGKRLFNQLPGSSIGDFMSQWKT